MDTYGLVFITRELVIIENGLYLNYNATSIVFTSALFADAKLSDSPVLPSCAPNWQRETQHWASVDNFVMKLLDFGVSPARY